MAEVKINPNLIGKTVTWTSQSQGSSKEKTGEIIAILQPGKNVMTVLPAGTKNSQLKTDLVNQRERIVVAVPRGGKSVMVDYYCPYERNVKIVGE